MMLVPTTLGPSPIHGIGLFATVGIPPGTIVWEWTLPIDVEIDDFELVLLPTVFRWTLERYAYRENGVWRLCGDDARFINHSDRPNVFSIGPERDVSVCRIEPGEEITNDYFSFDETASVKLG